MMPTRITPTPSTPPGPCSACIYWDGIGDGSIGKCRYNAPPVPSSSPQPGASSTMSFTTNNVYWPVTLAGDWCGQFSTTGLVAASTEVAFPVNPLTVPDFSGPAPTPIKKKLPSRKSSKVRSSRKGKR